MAIIRGNLPPYKVKSLSLDKLGIFNGTVIRHFVVGPDSQRVDPSWLLAAPTIWSIPCVEASAEVLDNGICEVTYTYDGRPDGSEPTDEQTLFELDTSMAEDPIETHPAFDLIKTIYGWDQTERRFAELLPETTGSNALTKDGGQNKRNPLFGQDSWLVVGAIFRRTRALRTIPADALTGIGTITKSPPNIGQFRLPSEGAKNRNWLKLSPKLSRRGNVVQCSDEWMMSGPNGWATPIYSAGQLG